MTTRSSSRLKLDQQHLSVLRQKITLFFSHHPALWIGIVMVLSLVFLPIEKSAVRPKESDYRKEWKEYIQLSLQNRFEKWENAALFSSLLMGTELPKDLKPLFKKTGLLHLVAISGFHFSLLSGYLFGLLGFLVKGRTRLTLLLFFLGGYAFFLGGLPSVLRAFFATSISLLSDLFNRRSKPLNTFGLSLVLTLLYDYRLLYQLSFQLSFGITYAILTLYPFLLEKVNFPSIEKVRKEPFATQCFLVLRTWFEKSLLFSLAVSSVAFPLSLYAFGAFPLFSILANLLFTPLFSLLVGGVLFSTLFPVLDPLIELSADRILSFLKLFDLPLPQVEGHCSFYFVIIVLLLQTALYISKERKTNLTQWCL